MANSEIARIYRERRALKAQGLKRCSRCKVIKPRAEFPLGSNTAWYKECLRAWYRQRQAEKQANQ